VTAGSPFGGGPLTVLRRAAPVSGAADLEGVLAACRTPDGGPVLLLSRCAPTAAFSRRDALRPGHARAVELATDAGYEPVVRPVGGHLAGYDEGSLVLHLWGPHPEPRRHLRERFATAGTALASALASLGVPDVRVGAVPGEYCEGEWSVNAGGTAKLAGTGQRLFRTGYLFCAVLTVTRPAPLVPMLTATYDALGLPLDPASVGAVDDWVPGVSVARVGEAVAGSLVRALAAPQGVALVG
jgi:octanoyl-[GcvH]:protein N-octanoyltransferase